MIPILIIMQIALLTCAIKEFIKNPYNFVAIFYLLYFVFYALPGIDYYYDFGLFGKELLDMTILATTEKIVFYNIISFLIVAMFYYGYIQKSNIKNNKQIDYKYDLNISNYYIIRNILIIAIMIIIMQSLINYSGNIFLFFSLSRKSDIYSSEYIRIMSNYIPLILFIIKVQKDLIIFKKIKKNVIFNILLIFLMSISSGQRRQIITNLIFITITIISSKYHKLNLKSFMKKSRSKIIMLGIISIILIPLLWWGRTYSTQLQRGDTITIMPWERRGGVELIFGSSSTGFKTMLLMDRYKEITNLNYGYPIKFFLSTPIPRTLYNDKPKMLVELIEEYFSLKGNPSMFYINELYMSFGIFSIIFSFILGRVMATCYVSNICSDDIFRKIYAVIIISNILMLFKNGVVSFIISCCTFFIMYYCTRRIIFTRKLRSD